MQAVGRLGSYITQGVYTVSGPFHPFGGAVDIVVVEQQDGTFKSSPWYVRFGKFQGVLKAKEKEKIVDISVNGIEASFHMYLDQKGEAFFLRDVNAEEGESVFYPSSSGNDTYDNRPLNSKSCNFDSGTSNSIAQIDIDNGKVMARTNSRRARILGLAFGRRSLKGAVEDDDMHRVGSLERAEIAANLLELKWSTNLASPRKDSKKTLGSSSRADNVESDFHQRKLEDEACSSTEQHGISSKSAFELGQEKGVINLSTRIDIAEEGERDPNVKEVIYDIGSTSSDLQVEHVELEARFEKQSNGEEVSGVNTVNILGNNISDEDISASGVQSPVKCETSESAKVGTDCSIEQTHEVLHLPSGGGGEVRVHTEVLHGTTILLPEGTETEEITKNFDLGMPITEVSEVHSRQTYCSNSDVSMYDVADVEDISTLPKSQTVNTGLGHCSAEKVESNYVTKTSNCNNVDDQALDDNNIKDKDVFSTLSSPFESFGDCSPRKSTRRSPSASSDGEFLLSDLDESRINHQFEGSISPEYVDKECHISSEIGTEKEDQLSCVNCNLHSSLENSTTENQMSDLEKLRGMSSPIAIPRNEAAVEEVGQCTESLPNMSSGINILGQDDVRYPLSQSLDSKSTSLQWTFPGDVDMACLKSDNDKEYKLPHEEPGAKDDHSSAEFESTALKLPIGMVGDAASEALNAEKLEINKFNSLGTEIMRDNKLVVKIGLHYFPWDAAAPIILGIVSFGNQQIIKRKGMVLVDQVGKNHTGDPSTKTPSPRRNWRIWPFSLKRSGSQKAMMPAPIDAKNTSFDNSSKSTISTDANKNELIPNLMQNKVRANSPTSEQLASLNLKEGGNIVAFTFSTAMLGKQQVDARIYLWKWNSRIVISDVDGTITRSDVLGQFMPLVGIDWSQTGVAHLFSAIKENGYQLLFLSARSISQAYITRQFLLNLKQDGKVLPDGPVVISPDGLFPSLYREVIRRAPHEFKIACLEDIKALFPSDCNPFYAGFGNRDTDEISYLKVGIPKGKIFIINPRGEIVVNRSVDTKSYTSLHALANGMFPPTNSSEQEDFNSWNFWKLPPPVMDI